MAGPLSSDEIEDVVSSVRRLVSADERPRPVTRDLAQDRLVLGPAFRVASETAADADPLVLTKPLGDGGRSGPGRASDPAPARVTDLTQTFEAEWEEELWTEPDPPLAELALGAEEAELLPEPPARPVAAAVADAPDPQPEESPWAEVGEDWLEDDPVPAATDAAAAAPHSGTADAKPASRPDVLKLSAEDMLTDGEGNPLTVLDEAALQQIIRQLIREELKGVLGERITQSVRKLVRAEINRALAAHALD